MSIYVTYTKKSPLMHTKSRFAVMCENMEQAREVGYNLNSRPDVSNIRINKSGRGLPEEAFIFFYNEYMNAK